MEKKFDTNELKLDGLPQRLCSEIQLFDLCDLASCRFKNGRFCCKSELLERFEKIADVELRSPERYIDEETENDDESDEEYDDYDDDYDDDDQEYQEGDWDEE